jgi:hypothetical protein
MTEITGEVSTDKVLSYIFKYFPPYSPEGILSLEDNVFVYIFVTNNKMRVRSGHTGGKILAD